MRPIRNLWRFGSLSYPGDRAGAPASWRYSVSAFCEEPELGKMLAFIEGCTWAHWVYVVTARWRLVKWLIAGALAGLWLAL